MEFEFCPRPRRRTLALQVTREGKLRVLAPPRVTREQAAAFVSMHRDWILRQQELQRQRRSLHPEPTPEQARKLQEQARRILPEKVAFYAKKMELQPAGVKITAAKTRFGSCSAKNILCFSWRLMEYPEEAIDYVVIHELAHILHKDHSPAFYRCVASVLPDHKQHRALLKR